MLNATKYVTAPEPFVKRTLMRYEVAANGCWMWQGSCTRDGYAQANYKVDGSQYSIYPHVLSYMVYNGPLIQGMQIDHACHDPETCIEPCAHRRCVNPEHLVQMPGRDNILRSGSPAAINARSTHCPQGHEYDLVDAAGTRRCSACRSEAKARQYERHGADYNAKRAEKMRTDEAYRERRLATQRASSASDAAKAKRRSRYANDPEYRERVKARVRERYERTKGR